MWEGNTLVAKLTGYSGDSDESAVLCIPDKSYKTEASHNLLDWTVSSLEGRNQVLLLRHDSDDRRLRRPE